MLEVRDLTKYYTSIPAVEGVSFVIRPRGAGLPRPQRIGQNHHGQHADWPA